MSAAAQIELGETVVQAAKNATATFAGGTIDVVYSSQSVDVTLVGHGAQSRFITIRAAQSALTSLGHDVDEETALTVASDLPNATGAYSVRQRTNAPNTGTVLLELRL